MSRKKTNQCWMRQEYYCSAHRQRKCPYWRKDPGGCRICAHYMPASGACSCSEARSNARMHDLLFCTECKEQQLAIKYWREYFKSRMEEYEATIKRLKDARKRGKERNE